MRLSEEFRAPGAQYRAIPFWAWNGKLEREELLRQIERLAQMGFGGFFMHSRTGLGTPYLSKEWFHFINACADKGKALGLSAWLYDEDRWPSGTAGGAVTQNPAYRMRFLRLCEDADAAEGTPLARFAVRMDGERWVSYRPLAADEAPQAGETALRFAVVEMPCSSFYNGTTYVDTMNREATETFLQMTHQRYVEECGARIGDSILGIFTDEPHRGSLMTSFGQGVDAGERQIPWTAALPERFQEKYGYDLLANLPALFLKKDEMPAQIKWQYVELVEELFLENFARPIDQWCRAHRMILTGHVLHEDCLTAQTAMSGSMMRYYAEMELPGIDFLGEFGRCYWIAKQLQSVARQLNKPRLLSELDGCTGWQMGFENYKAVGDWQALYGINLRCPHLSWYTMEGQAKRDYPASIFHQSAWWKEYAYVEDYYARIARFAQDGEPVCRVLVVSPLESVWARIHPGWCDGLSAKEAHVKALEERYAQLFYLLQRRHIDFDYGDEGLMAEHAAAEGKRLRVGQARYDAVLVCGLDTVRGTTERMLREFAAGGGRLIVCGEAPKAVDCLPGGPEWPQAIRIPFEEEALAAALREYEVASLTLPGGEPARDILCQAKRVAGETRLLLLNDNREAAVNGVELSIAGHGPVTRFIPETGELERLPARESEGAVHVRLDFAPKAMLLLSIGGAYPEAKAPRVCQTIARQECAASALRYELAEPNLCVLDQASVSLNGGAWSEELEILKADRHVRDAFHLPYRGGEMLQPWFIGQRDLPVCGEAALRFSFEVETLPEGPLYLVMEEIQNFTTELNGTRLAQTVSGFSWVDACFSAYEVPASLLHLGRNEVILRTGYRESSNLEALYLMGNFGVRLDGARRTLTALPATLRVGSVTEQGLPFYSGKLTYLVPAPQWAEKGGRTVLEMGRFAGACVTLEGNGKRAMIAWQPYEADVTGMVENGVLRVTDVLTRRNTFGPLHQVPALAYAYGPENFETTGDRFSPAYSLVEAGLMETPAFRLEVPEK